MTTPIQGFFTGKTVLVTGATGFLGKALVEKILRSLPELHRLYVLIRPKERQNRTLSADERFWGEVLKSSIFDRLKGELGNRFDAVVEEKVAVVNGDLTDERLGVSADDYRRLSEEVQVIINSAAVVVFDERLDLSLNLNTMGAKRMMDFARDCARLEAVVHISTCYVSGTRKGWVHEDLTPPAFDVEAEAQRLEAACGAVKARHGGDRQKAKEELVRLGLAEARKHGWNDTYTFTKWMGEQLTLKYRGDLPTVILRPAIIESTFREPEAGWIDGFRMGDPLFVGYGKGQLKDFPARQDVICDLIPCDHVVNAILACAPACARDKGFKIYQIATGDQNPVHFRTIFDIGRDYFTRNPMFERDGTKIPTPVWTFPTIDEYRRALKWRYEVPLAVAAAALRPLSFVRKIDKARRRVQVKRAGLDLLKYYVDIYSPYTTIEARFGTANTQALWASLSPEDQRLFDFDARGIDWRDYIANVHIPGLKRNVLNLTVEELEEGSGTPVRTIPDLLARSADRAPEATALQAKRAGTWQRLTYDDLQRRVEEAAARLHAFGLHKGDRVLLYAENAPEWGVAFLAAASLGAVVVPVDRQMRPADVLVTANYVTARAILTSASAQGAFAGATVPLLNIDAGCEAFAASATPTAASRPRLHHSSLVGPDDLAAIVFTRGVGGDDPRGVLLTHRNFVSNVMGVVQLLPPRANDHFLSVLPLHHTLELTGGFLVPLYVGAAVSYAEAMSSRAILDALRETRATTMIGVPRVFQILHQALSKEVAKGGRWARFAFRAKRLLSRAARALTGRDIGRRLFADLHALLGGQLRAFVCGGAALAPQVFDHFQDLGIELCEGYGLTETAPIVTANPLGGAKRGSVGLPLPGVEVTILAPDARGVGEVAVRGPNVTAGYFNNPAATAAALRGGWFHTGDLGHLDKERYLFLTGRLDDVIVTAAGKNVYPEEVESLYSDLPRVAQLCVVGVWDDDVHGETVQAVVVPTGEGRLAGPHFEEEVRRAVQDRSRGLPTYQRLQRVHVLDGELPRTAAGAVDRPRVRQQVMQRVRSARGPSAAPADEDGEREPPPATNGRNGPARRTNPSEAVRGVVARVAGVSTGRVASASDLEADLSLDSLSKVELLLALETYFHVPIPEGLMPSLHTVGDVVEAVRGRLGAAPPVGRGEASPQWGKVLAPRGVNDTAPWLRRGPVKKAARLLTRFLMRLYGRVWFGLEVRGAENLPQGGFIVASSHCSHLDTGAVVVAFGKRGRDLFVMGARDYFFNSALKGWFFHTFLNVIPFDRTEKVIEGLRLARAVLAEGLPVLIYPEGRRSVSGEVMAFKPGIGLLGVELDVPIVPCLVEGTYQSLPKGKSWPRRNRIRVTFGKPLTMAAYREQAPEGERVALYRRVAEDVRAEVLKLKG